MTVPRQVLPGATYLVSRRCAQQEFLLKPSKRTTAVFKFVLAVAAKRYRVLVHAACVMSNHYHLVVTDPDAQLPRFTQFLDGVVARALNASHGRWEAFWAPASYSAVPLVSPKDVLGKIVYALANPVLAGLVAHGSEWPGLWSAPESIGARGESVERPDHFFSKHGTMPDREALVFSAPPGFGGPAAFREELQRVLARCEKAKAEKMRSRNLRFAGIREVLRQKPTARPATVAKRRGLRPRVAARDRWRRVEALRRLADFVRAYREALAKLQAGVEQVLFPRGTYLLRVHLRVACEPA